MKSTKSKRAHERRKHRHGQDLAAQAENSLIGSRADGHIARTRKSSKSTKSNAHADGNHKNAKKARFAFGICILSTGESKNGENSSLLRTC